MDETILQIPCELSSSATRAISKSTKLVFESQEAVPPSIIARITENVGKVGWLSFLVSPDKDRLLDSMDVLTLPEIKAEKGQKTKAQRLRAVIYCLWETSGKQGDSETYYNVKMEQLIEMLKSKLPES